LPLAAQTPATTASPPSTPQVTLPSSTLPVLQPNAAPQALAPQAPGAAATGSASAVAISGNYTAAGTNPDGTHYTATVVIKNMGGNNYSFVWQTGSQNQTYNGTGALNGSTITVDWGQSAPVIYQVGSDGALRGTWDNGRASEILTRQ
jgi:hypothetical protein